MSIYKDALQQDPVYTGEVHVCRDQLKAAAEPRLVSAEYQCQREYDLQQYGYPLRAQAGGLITGYLQLPELWRRRQLDAAPGPGRRTIRYMTRHRFKSRKLKASSPSRART